MSGETVKLARAVKVEPWLYSVRHFQLIHNLATDRWGWFVEEDGKIEAWYADKETALAVKTEKGKQ